ncbi:MAG TPA: hypothetical protein IAC41_11065 [Candidatus Merdenecus merdavium]|nr:hypothetical protein [Candidatus Merdenecus merdavium]
MNKSYEDMIQMPHHISKRRPPMNRMDRAAQFAPFAALNGHQTAVRETARLTVEKKELEQDKRAILDRKLQLVQGYLEEEPELTITYFKPDPQKSGGSYIKTTGRVKKIDFFTCQLRMKDGMEIPVNDIFEISGSLFHGIYD